MESGAPRTGKSTETKIIAQIIYLFAPLLCSGNS
jgi:hypothetical protein